MGGHVAPATWVPGIVASGRSERRNLFNYFNYIGLIRLSVTAVETHQMLAKWHQDLAYKFGVKAASRRAS